MLLVAGHGPCLRKLSLGCRAGDIFAINHFSIFAIHDMRMRADKSRNLGHRAPVAAFAALGDDKRLRLAERGDGFETRPADSLAHEIADDCLGPTLAERLVVAIRPNGVGMTVDAKAHFGKLTDPARLFEQRLSRASVKC